jgi:hypothetical protein
MKTSNLIESFLHKNGPSTVRDLSLALGVSKADIRYNLKLLKRADKIAEVPPAANSLTRGRPSARFILVNQLTVNNLEHLLNLVLTRQFDKKPPEQIVDELMPFVFDNDNIQLSPLSRIQNTIEFLGNLGLLASWTAGKTGPHISIINNPYKKENPQPYELVVDLLIERVMDYVSKT